MQRVARRLVFILIFAVLSPRVIFADASDTVDTVRLLVGRSTVVDLGTSITRVSLTSSDVADALVTSPTQLLVHGKTPGTISMFVWEKTGVIRRYEVTVQRDLSRLIEQVHQLFPTENVGVASNGKTIVLSGSVTSQDVADKAVALASGYVDKKEEVVNLLRMQEGLASNQVLLRVRFAEVSRSALTEFGVGLFTSATGIKNNVGRVTTQQFPTAEFSDLQVSKANSNWGSEPTSASGKFTFSDFLNLFLFNEKYDLGTTIKAMQNRGLFQSLAEPNLVSESGKEASFLAGGEFPVPIAQASSGGTSVTVMFKEFGIRLTFTPTVTGVDRVHLKVRPEVSTLDFANGVVLNGFRVPALATRRTETELELNDNQTFAIAGLLNNSVNQSLQKIPGIGDIPILGQLFRSRAAQKDQTELVVMITPQILPRNSRGVTPNLPRLQEQYLPQLPPNRSRDVPPPAFVPGGSGTSAQAPNATPVTGPQSPAAAAAAVSALTPGTRAVVNGNAKSGDAPATSSGKPLTSQEQKMLERAQKEGAQGGMSAEERKRAAKQAGEEYRKQKAEQDRQAKIAAEQAKKQAGIDAEAARRAAEKARKQAEIDQKQQKSIAEAEARLKAAQAAYQAEVNKKEKPQ